MSLRPRLPLIAVIAAAALLVACGRAAAPGPAAPAPSPPPATGEAAAPAAADSAPAPPKPGPAPEPEPPPDPALAVSLSAPAANQGDFLVLQLAAPDGFAVTEARIDGWSPAPRPFALNGGQTALLAIAYDALPGEYELTVAASLTHPAHAGTVWELEERVAFTVLATDFDHSYVYLDEETAALPADPQVAADYARLRDLREQPSPVPLWEGAFIQPAEGWISTGFGDIRYVNDIESGRHNGVDLANDHGTPVHAANAGRVVLADYLVMTGYTVVIDHGLGLYSSYSHLDELLTEAGESVGKGDLIGLMGTTGFSTGPHLHFVLNIFHDAVNPWQPITDGDPLLWAASAGGAAGAGEGG